MIVRLPAEILEDAVWQMSGGERAAVEGVLCRSRPKLALEIGTAQGGGTQRIAAYAQEVHSFDLAAPLLELPANVHTHQGDSHELLAPFLAQLAEQERNVDFVIVDGDHTPEGVRRDLEDLLNSPALARSVILIHDTVNERVRAGVDAVRFAAWPKVAHVDLDWIPGRLFATPELRGELWYGLGLVVLDAGRPAYLNGSPYEQRYHSSAPLLARARNFAQARERGAENHEQALEGRVAELEAALNASHERLAALQDELTAANVRIGRGTQVIEDLQRSPSWRITAPLRAAKRRARGARPSG